MKKRITVLLVLLPVLGLQAFSEENLNDNTNWIQPAEEIKPVAQTNIEKAEQEVNHMQEKVDYYNRVVRSIEREEAELRELRKLKIKNPKKITK